MVASDNSSLSHVRNPLRLSLRNGMRRDSALVRIQNYQNETARYYNSNVRQRRFHEGDRVLRKVFQNTTEPNAGKLVTNWEGPYLISKVVRPGVYELADLNGKAVPRSWNAMHLRKYYN